MSDRRVSDEMVERLYDVLVSLDSRELCKAFLDDLCTYKEVEQMAQRIKTAELLLEGKTYVQVMDEVNISSTTLSRVSRCIQFGEGYNRVLKKKENE